MIAALGVTLTILAPKVAFAEPKCAITYGGPVTCPVNVGNNSNDCFLYDSGDSSKGWQKVDCKSDQFKKANTEPSTLPPCTEANDSGCDPALACTGKNCDVVQDYVNPAINVLAAMVGVTVVISIVVAGIQYSASADDPQRVAQAKRRITNALLALLGSFVFYAFLQWLIPGGFFN